MQFTYKRISQKKLDVSSRLGTPYHAQAIGLVERFNSSFKNLLHFVMRQFGRKWLKAVPFLIWELRECPDATTGVSPFVLQYGIQPHSVLSLLKNDWTGFDTLPKTKTVKNTYLTYKKFRRKP